MSDRRNSVPANIEPFVRVLGEDGAIDFLLAFGGAELYLARTPTGRSRVAQLVGVDKASALAAAAENLPRRVPLAKEWLINRLRAKGLPVMEIARMLRVSDVTVRTYLKAPEDRPAMKQLPLF